MRLIGSTGLCADTKQLSCAAGTPVGQIRKSQTKFEATSSMPEPDLIELFVRPLNDLGIRFLVSGSVAGVSMSGTALWKLSEPATHDLEA